MTFDLRLWSAERLDRVEAALSAWVPPDAPAELGEAMRYAVLDGGKRLRPLLVLAAAEAVQGNQDAALRAACSVELIHAYSLVHDDMPCVDNDILRRGKPTVHKAFDEATAVLAGDCFHDLAFEIMADEASHEDPFVRSELILELARASGVGGMGGGQMLDLDAEGKSLDIGAGNIKGNRYGE